jgi:hypothetical protein
MTVCGIDVCLPVLEISLIAYLLFIRIILFSMFSILSLSFLISPELFKVAFFYYFFNLPAEDNDPCLDERNTS